MKFMGLILMCAASSMALLLPAMGVVKFPVLDETTLQSLVGEAQIQATELAVGQTGEQFGGQLSNTLGNTLGDAKNRDPQTSAGMLVAAQVSGQPSNPEATGSQSKTSGSTKTEYLGKIPFTQIGSQRVGLGVWLLLLPTILLGLAMWTFGSSPKSSK